MSFHPIRSLIAILAQRDRAPEWIRFERTFGRLPNDRDKAERVGMEVIAPALSRHRMVVLDLRGVDVATQSFFHSLLRPALADRPHLVSRLVVANGTEPNIAALELALEFLIRDHNRSKSPIEPKVRRYETLAPSH